MNNLGLFAQGAQANGDAQFLTLAPPAVGTAPVGTSQMDLTTTPPSVSTNLISNGTAYVIAPGPDGCLYMGQGVGVFRITDASGGCNYAAANPPPTLVLSPSAVVPNPAKGTTQTVTASIHYATVPTGTPINFAVAGANPQIGGATTNASGQATFTYTGVYQGVDTITATTTIAASPVSSNSSVITWGPGSDVTFLSLNPSPTSGTSNQSVNLVASLSDTSVSPAVPLAGQSISFMLGGSSCGGTTNASGLATCTTSAGSAGTKTLSASFAGTSQYVASNAAVAFNVVAPATASPTPTPTATPTPSGASIEVSPADLVFPPRAGNRGKATRKFKITNIGTSELIGYVMPLEDTAFFVRKNGGSFSLAPGRSREVTVLFKPPQTGNFTSNVLIVSNDPLHPQLTVTLSGIGTPRPK